MKKIKCLSMIAVLITSLFLTVITAYADSDLSTARIYRSLAKLTVSASGYSDSTYLLRMDLPDSGTIKFRADSFNVSDSAKYSILNSKGKELLSSGLSSLKGRNMKFKKAGTYYLRLSLKAGNSIRNMYYTYIADNGLDDTNSITLRKGETTDAKKYVNAFTQKYIWLITNSRVATIKSGKICALEKGKATFEAHSSNGDHAKIIVNVVEEGATGMEILGANMIWVGESFKYSYAYDDNKDYSDNEVVWSVSGKGTVNKNGMLKAAAKGDAVLTVTDKTSGLSASMTVHFISDARDVDFVPMINGIPIANKTYPLPASYSPGLDAEAKAAYDKLAADAAKEGLNFYIISSFRSYNKQVATYNHWVSVYGKAEADRCSARPGFSEHQLGLAIDVNSCYTSFANTKEGKWLAKNCWKYGFILRYPTVASEKITGYIYEPWHIRYLGKDLAKTIYQSGLTLEEYLGIDSYYRQ